MNNILQIIGNTPLIKLTNICKKKEGTILFKYERNNPGGSIKDRPAIHIIEEAEQRGLLKKGGTIIESSSGNFGISLAMIGAAKGYKVIILVDPKTTKTNLSLLKTFGAEVIVVTEKDDCGSYHKTRISLANKLAEKIENSFRPDQCFSLLNSEAHYIKTAREIIEQSGGGIKALIAPVSTGGQLGGLSKYMKKYYPKVKIIGVDAIGSAVFGGESHSYKIPGIGLGWTPENINMNNIDAAYKVSDEDAFISARAIARNEGILMGPSSGACALVALNIAQNSNFDEKIVCMISDGGERYIETLFNDEWMKKQGFSTNVGLEKLRYIATQLKIWTSCTLKCSNYNSNLTKSLNVPDSTIKINKEILQKYSIKVN